MVHIVYHRSACALTVRGHALGGEKGHDPVCAGVSALVLTLAANVTELVTQGNVRQQVVHIAEGDAQIRCTPTPRMQSVVTLIYDTVCSGFGLLQTLYPQNISYRMTP